MNGKSILLIISGSIAAIKTPDVIRRLGERGIAVRVILTQAGGQFVSATELEALSGHHVYQELFSKTDEDGMEHIRLSREADLVVVAPASADLIAKMANGYANDLASAALLANNKKILVAPAMNTQMWNHPATGRNLARLTADGATIIPPGVGLLACGETGAGRMAEPDVIVEAIARQLAFAHQGEGLKALVTSGPTYEAIDPVRYIGNHSSGKQGHAIAATLAQTGMQVTLVSGPTALPGPAGVNVVHVTSAEEMLKACEAALPVDVAVCAAAVADWRVSQPSARKLKKSKDGDAPEIRLIENPDILAHLSRHPAHRPALVIGFAAETNDTMENAAKKLQAKGCDWILANDVSGNKGFGADDNQVTLLADKTQEQWPLMSKQAIAQRLVEKIITTLGKTS